MIVESDGKLKHLVESIEEWLSPYLHQHEISEVIEEAAAVAVAEEAAIVNKAKSA